MRRKFGLGLKTSFQIAMLTLLFCSGVQAQVVDRIVAIVDSEIITLVDLKLASKPYIKQVEAAGYPEDQFREMESQIYKKVLDVLIDQSLTEQEARKYGISVSEQELENAIENMNRQQSISQEQLEKFLQQEGSSMKAYKDSIRKKILQSKLVNHAVKSKVVITDSEMQAYYDANQSKYAGVKKYHLRNILMTGEDDIKEIYKKLTSKKKFTTLAKNYSMAPNASDGGDLGLFDINNFNEDIKNQIQGLKKGDFSKVISTAQGFQIFYVEDILFEGKKTLEQAHDEIYEKLYEPKVEEKFKSWLDSLKEQAHIENKL